MFVAEAQVVLSVDVILLGGFRDTISPPRPDPLRRLYRCRSRCPESALSLGEILFGGFAIPLHGLHLVLHHTFAVCVAETQVVLGLGVMLLGGLAIPFHRLSLVLRHAFAFVIAEPNCIELGEILFGGFAKPLRRLHRILRHTFAGAKQTPRSY